MPGVILQKKGSNLSVTKRIFDLESRLRMKQSLLTAHDDDGQVAVTGRV